VLPRPGVDVRAGGAILLYPPRTPRLEAAVGLDAEYWTPRVDEGADPPFGGRYQLWAISTRGCVGPRLGRIGLPSCVGAGAGAMHGRGEGELVPGSAASPWAFALASFGVDGTITPRLGLRAEAELDVALVRPAFDTEQGRLLYRAGPVAGRVWVVLEVRGRRR
jgi:hypothetical protein